MHVESSAAHLAVLCTREQHSSMQVYSGLGLTHSVYRHETTVGLAPPANIMIQDISNSDIHVSVQSRHSSQKTGRATQVSVGVYLPQSQPVHQRA